MKLWNLAKKGTLENFWTNIGTLHYYKESKNLWSTHYMKNFGPNLWLIGKRSASVCSCLTYVAIKLSRKITLILETLYTFIFCPERGCLRSICVPTMSVRLWSFNFDRSKFDFFWPKLKYPRMNYCKFLDGSNKVKKSYFQCRFLASYFWVQWNFLWFWSLLPVIAIKTTKKNKNMNIFLDKDDSEDEGHWKSHLIVLIWKHLNFQFPPNLFWWLEVFTRFFSAISKQRAVKIDPGWASVKLTPLSLLSNQNKSNCGAHVSNLNINEFSWTAGNQM